MAELVQEDNRGKSLMLLGKRVSGVSGGLQMEVEKDIMKFLRQMWERSSCLASLTPVLSHANLP